VELSVRGVHVANAGELDEVIVAIAADSGIGSEGNLRVLADVQRWRDVHERVLAGDVANGKVDLAGTDRCESRSGAIIVPSECAVPTSCACSGSHRVSDVDSRSNLGDESSGKDESSVGAHC